jgi:hypothetical protein
VPTNDSSTTGDRPVIDQSPLERDALALGLLEQTARRLRNEVDQRLASTPSAKRSAQIAAEAGADAAARLADSMTEWSTLDGPQLLELAETLVRGDACVVASTDGWIAAATIEPRAAA